MQLTNLAIGYRSRHATHVVAQDINATLAPGRLTCLLGANGAGKSTLLRTLAAFQPPLGGNIVLDGRQLNAYTPSEIATRIGVVLTERLDIREMRVRELVAMGRSPYTGFWGRLSAADERAVDDAIALVGIEALERRMVRTLSDGERQKALIAKALAQQTPIILLDEPTAFLDFPSKAGTMLLLSRLAHEMHKTIFLSTHDLDMALQTADELWLMGKAAPPARRDGDGPGGQQLLIGTPRQLSASGELARFFAGPGIEFDARYLCFRVSPGGTPPAAER